MVDAAGVLIFWGAVGPQVDVIVVGRGTPRLTHHFTRSFEDLSVFTPRLRIAKKQLTNRL